MMKSAAESLEGSYLDPLAVAALRNLAEDVAAAGENVLAELLQTFREDATERSRALRHSIERAQDDTVCALLHALKGASATIGAARLSALCAQLEADVRAGSLPDAPTLARFDACIERTLAELSRAFAAGPGTSCSAP